jgi:hypothetical protein
MALAQGPERILDLHGKSSIFAEMKMAWAAEGQPFKPAGP